MRPEEDDKSEHKNRQPHGPSLVQITIGGLRAAPSCRRSRGHGTSGGKIVGIASEIDRREHVCTCDNCIVSDYWSIPLLPARPQTARTMEHSGERENSMNRRFALALSGLLFASVPATAQYWPTKTVRIIVPFGPGSTPDMVGRLIADHMQQKLGQPFVIENRPGASANTGTEMVAKAD